MRTRKLVGLALAGAATVAGLAACGGSGAGGSPPAPTVANVARANHVTGLEPDNPVELYAKAQQTGTLPDGRQVRIYIFATSEAHNNWTQAASQFGGTTVYRKGQLWEIDLTG